MANTSQKNSYKYFQLYSCCIPVKGWARSIICDLQRQDFIIIPNELFILFDYRDRTISLPLTYSSNNEEREQLVQLIHKIEDHEYGYFTNEPERFPNLSSDLRHPSVISNAIIDLNSSVQFNFKRFISELSDLLCQSVLIRAYTKVELSTLFEILKAFENTSIRSVELVIPFDEGITKEYLLTELIGVYGRCRRITVHSSPFDQLITGNTHEIIYSTARIINETCCGNISPYYFNSNYSSFFEAKVSNSCLNKKLSIDQHGYVKNCPSMRTNYGHYDQISDLKSLLNDSAFKDLWKITKDDITICKDCEFRYICHDCRVFVQGENDRYSKPSKCKYNPYKAVWESSELVS